MKWQNKQNFFDNSPRFHSCRCTEAHRRPATGSGERLPLLQHLQHCLQAAYAQERHRLDARRGIGMRAFSQEGQPY